MELNCPSCCWALALAGLMCIIRLPQCPTSLAQCIAGDCIPERQHTPQRVTTEPKHTISCTGPAMMQHSCAGQAGCILATIIHHAQAMHVICRRHWLPGSVPALQSFRHLASLMGCSSKAMVRCESAKPCFDPQRFLCDHIGAAWKHLIDPIAALQDHPFVHYSAPAFGQIPFPSIIRRVLIGLLYWNEHASCCCQKT